MLGNSYQIPDWRPSSFSETSTVQYGLGPEFRASGPIRVKTIETGIAQAGSRSCNCIPVGMGAGTNPWSNIGSCHEAHDSRAERWCPLVPLEFLQALEGLRVR